MGLCYSNIPNLKPRDIFLQFTRARGKKTTKCVAHGQCRGFEDQNSIPHNEFKFFPRTTRSHPYTVWTHSLRCKQPLTNKNVDGKHRKPLSPIVVEGNVNVQNGNIYDRMNSVS